MATLRPVPAWLPAFIGGVEGCVLRVYDDARPTYVLKPGDAVIGTLTAGYGHTGGELYIGLDVTQAMADGWRALDALKAARIVCGKLTDAALARLSDHQYGCMVDFCFNLGAAGSQIWIDLNKGDLKGARDQIPLFDHGRVGGKSVEIAGLKHRRSAELVLWDTPDVTVTYDAAYQRSAQEAVVAAAVAPVQVAAAAGIVAPPSSVTRALDTSPRTPGPALVKKGPFQVACAAATGCVAHLASQAPDIADKAKGFLGVAKDTLAGQVDAAPKLATALEFIGYGLVGMAVLVPLAMWLKDWGQRHQPG